MSLLSVCVRSPEAVTARVTVNSVRTESCAVSGKMGRWGSSAFSGFPFLGWGKFFELIIFYFLITVYIHQCISRAGLALCLRDRSLPA